MHGAIPSQASVEGDLGPAQVIVGGNDTTRNSISEGDKVVLCYLSGNRDESVFPEVVGDVERLSNHFIRGSANIPVRVHPW